MQHQQHPQQLLLPHSAQLPRLRYLALWLHVLLLLHLLHEQTGAVRGLSPSLPLVQLDSQASTLPGPQLRHGAVARVPLPAPAPLLLLRAQPRIEPSE